MAILLNNNGYGNEQWYQALSKHLPDMPVHCYPDIPDQSAIKYALVWDHPKGDLANYPNLKAILSLGAGVEHLAEDPELPDLPIVRLVDPAVANDMAMHTLYWVINFQRHYHIYQRQQTTKKWYRYRCEPNDRFRVGIMGLGNIGSAVADKIKTNGYPVSAWDLIEKTIADVNCFAGDAQLAGFLKNQDVIVSCLPLTKQTKNMINGSFFRHMKQKSFLINVSRGAVLNEEDLLFSLGDGRLSAAALDTLTIEPLPDYSPLWDHPNIYITPHMSGATDAGSAVIAVAKNITLIEAGEKPSPLYDRAEGY